MANLGPDAVIALAYGLGLLCGQSGRAKSMPKLYPKRLNSFIA